MKLKNNENHHIHKFNNKSGESESQYLDKLQRSNFSSEMITMNSKDSSSKEWMMQTTSKSNLETKKIIQIDQVDPLKKDIFN